MNVSDIEDIKHITLFNDGYKDEAFEYFYLKYYHHIKNVCMKAINRSFYSVPIEYEDLNSVAYQAIDKVMKSYNPDTCNYTVKQAIFTISVSDAKKMAIKLIKNTEYILNNSISFDVLTTKGFNSSDNHTIEKQNTALYHEIEFEKFLNSKYLNKKIVKEIAVLKMKNYTNQEIAEKLKITPKKVANIILYMKKIGKQIKSSINKNNL